MRSVQRRSGLESRELAKISQLILSCIESEVQTHESVGRVDARLRMDPRATVSRCTLHCEAAVVLTTGRSVHRVVEIEGNAMRHLSQFGARLGGFCSTDDTASGEDDELKCLRGRVRQKHREMSEVRAKRCWLLFVAPVLLFSLGAQGAEYEVSFVEGAYKFDVNASPTDVNNKYLARVTIKKDGQVVAKDIRGSTLPDAWAFYVRWNVELKKATAPKDSDVVEMFDHFEKQTTELAKSGAKLGETKLADIAGILDVLNHVPAIPSGSYTFVTGLHKQGTSVHGKPYAARLLGATAEKPYDPRDANSKATEVGGFIRTLNKNNVHGQRRIANGINVHDGRTSKDYKDSEGCLTVRPQDWAAFHGALPSPEDWKKEKHTGRLVVIR